MKIKPDFPGRCRCLSFCLRVAALLFAILSGFPASAATGQKMELTVYNDGKSCPKGCDAHVVFAKEHDGTANAFLPTHPVPPYKECIPGQLCRICFETEARHCMDVMYRGRGPHPNKFDVTPKFIEKYCPVGGNPPELNAYCQRLTRLAKNYLSNINCITHPQHEKCSAVIAEANKNQRDDLPAFEQCIKMGEKKFNKLVNAEQQRTKNCVYALNIRRKNTLGKTWQILLPGACYAGTYVGRDGLDCCTGNPLTDSLYGIECNKFYPKP